MYHARNIAKYIIEKSNRDNKPISNLKLQKILYFIQAEFLVDKGEACFSEDIEAWDLGPVVPEVYHIYKIYGSYNISSAKGLVMPKIRNEDKKIIDSVVEECYKYTVSQLVDITHRQTPWIEAYRLGRNSIISNESIKSYFDEG